MKKNIPSSMGQIIGTNKVGVPILKPTKSDIARNLAKSRAMVEEAASYSDVRGGLNDR